MENNKVFRDIYYEKKELKNKINSVKQIKRFQDFIKLKTAEKKYYYQNLDTKLNKYFRLYIREYIFYKNIDDPDFIVFFSERSNRHS